MCFHSFLQDITSEEQHLVLIRILAVAGMESVSSLQSISRHRILGNGFPRLTKQGKKVRKWKVVFHTKTQFSFCKTILHRVSFLLLWSHYWIENSKTAKRAKMKCDISSTTVKFIRNSKSSNSKKEIVQYSRHFLSEKRWIVKLNEICQTETSCSNKPSFICCLFCPCYFFVSSFIFSHWILNFSARFSFSFETNENVNQTIFSNFNEKSVFIFF